MYSEKYALPYFAIIINEEKNRQRVEQDEKPFDIQLLRNLILKLPQDTIEQHLFKNYIPNELRNEETNANTPPFLHNRYMFNCYDFDTNEFVTDLHTVINGKVPYLSNKDKKMNRLVLMVRPVFNTEDTTSQPRTTLIYKPKKAGRPRKQKAVQ